MIMRASAAYALIGALTFGLAGAASAADAMKSMPGMPGMAAEPAAKTGQGTGVVKAIDAKAGTITLQHGPIPAVGWPAMTMAFKATPSVIQKAKVGQTIDFDAKVQGTSAEVTAVRPK
jgi:Cu(I)/Ag(I) efflux system protein CusF